MNKCIYVSLLATCFLFISSCKKTPEKIVSINPSEFSIADQIKIGDAFNEAIKGNSQVFTVLEEDSYPQAYQYLSRLLQTLLFTSPVMHRSDYDWTLNIVQNDELHMAFFLPGGHLYIYTGLLKVLENESQLLGVLGHELYYVDTDIMIKAMKKELGGTNLGDILLDNYLPNLSELATQMPYLQIEEDEVLEADAFSINLICPFQYDANGIQSILEKAQMEENIDQCLWLQTRLFNYEKRIKQAQANALLCGEEGITNEVYYQEFVNEMLP